MKDSKPLACLKDMKLSNIIPHAYTTYQQWMIRGYILPLGGNVNTFKSTAYHSYVEKQFIWYNVMMVNEFTAAKLHEMTSCISTGRTCMRNVSTIDARNEKVHA